MSPLSQFVLFLLIAPTLSDNAGLGIYNGQSTTWNNYGFMVSIPFALQGVDDHCCGGSILSLNPPIILTAAHCLFECYVWWYPENSVVKIGCNGPQCSNPEVVTYFVAESNHHPLWDGLTMQYDVGLIRLDRVISAPSNVQTVTLQSYSPCCIENESLRVLGYGYVSTGNSPASSLQTAIEYFVDLNKCSEEMPPNTFIGSSHMCFIDIYGSILSAITVCFGDSGSPVLKDNTNVQVGIVSFGEHVFESLTCDGRYPQVGADVGDPVIYDWIVDQI
eukprot:549324_1